MPFLVNVIKGNIVCAPMLLLSTVQVLIIFSLVHTSIALDTDIDQDHMAMFPYCGGTFQGSSESKARAINAQDSKHNYRWSAIVWRENTGPKSGKKFTSFCSGSIITDR